MTDMNAYAAFESMFVELNDAVGEFDDRRSLTAADALSHFSREGGNVRTLTDQEFSVRHEPTSELDGWDDPWPVTYGIDGSTTRPLRFSNGLIAGASAAKLGVAGESDTTELARHTTTTLVAHLNDDSFSMRGGRSPGLDTTEDHAYRFQFPASDRLSRIEDYVVDVSRTYAEGRHAREHASDLDGPLFVDGPLYPPSAFGWMVAEQANTGRREMTEVWPEMVGDILQNYVSTIETMYDDDLPIVGIVKTGGSSDALTALEDKIRRVGLNEINLPLRWTSDVQLFSNALDTDEDTHGDRGHVISYTPWLFQSAQNVGGESIVPFEMFDGVSLAFGDPREYQRAFFYVRCPRSNVVMRAETPYMFARKPELRDRIQRKVLVELAQQQKEPLAITLADENARITKNDRKHIREFIDADYVESHTELRNYDRFEVE
jgi:hypothetical protein